MLLQALQMGQVGHLDEDIDFSDVLHRGTGVHFHDVGIVVRTTGETIALTPPLTVTENDIDKIAEMVGKIIKSVA